MSMSEIPGLLVRKLLAQEWERFRDHLLRLDADSRRLRFAHAVSDSFIEDYALRMCEMGGIVVAAIIDGEVRACAELRKLGDTWGREAEAAFSVERAYQERGLGSELMGRIVRAARTRGVQLLYICCLAENAKMLAIARRHDAVLRLEYGEVIGEIMPDAADFATVMAEAVEDRAGYLLAVLDLQSRLVKAA